MLSKRVEKIMVPYPVPGLSGDLGLMALIDRRGSILTVESILTGNLNQVIFPIPSKFPQRRDHLWEQTCFEVFFTWSEQGSYFELNSSPSGDWNLFSFENYRSGKSQEFKVKEFIHQRGETSSEEWRNKISIDLEPILPLQNIPLFVSVTAVIEYQDRRKSYWAVEHLGSEPDFHLRKSFSIQV